MELDKQLREFQVVVYGNLEKYSETISKSRCRIFYKKLNRNGTYITDEFAERLVRTLPYAPVKGIHDSVDFTDHGQDRSEGQIYGVIPAEPNFAWETHLDPDGIERVYACADVLLYTALYTEAKDIVGKSQSMEIYEPSIKGEWKLIEGRKAFVYTDGCFLGLQVLGDSVEPCFEGSAFFSLYKGLYDLVEALGQYEKNLNVPKSNEGGKKKMFNFKLSDDAKYTMLFDLLNPNCDQEHDWDIDYMLMEVYDDYVLTYNCKKKHYERVNYTKNDAEDSITIGESVQVFIVDITESEKNALDTIRALNGGTYEKLDENFGLNSEHEEKVSEYEQKITEFSTSISTLEGEKEELSNQITAAEETIGKLNSTIQDLDQYKLNVENDKKEAILSKYSVRVSEEVINTYRDSLADYTTEQLDEKLAFELVKSDPSIFSVQGNTNEEIIPTTNTRTKSNLELVLDKYQDK